MKYIQVRHELKAGDLVETIEATIIDGHGVVPMAYVPAGRIGVVLDVYVASSEDGYDYPAVKVDLLNDNRVMKAPEKYFKLVQRPEGPP